MSQLKENYGPASFLAKPTSFLLSSQQSNRRNTPLPRSVTWSI